MKHRGRHYLMGCGQSLQSQLAWPRRLAGKTGRAAVCTTLGSVRSAICATADRRGKSR